MTKEILDVVAEYGYASVPLLQKRCNMTYVQASKTLDELLNHGVVSFGETTNCPVNKAGLDKVYVVFGVGSEKRKSESVLADNDAISKYRTEFYKKALLYVIRQDEIKPISIAMHFRVNYQMTMDAVVWMKNNNCVEKKPDKLAKVLITEKQFYEKFGPIDDSTMNFDEMYWDALYLCVKNKQYSKAFVGRTFVSSVTQLDAFDKWVKENGFVSPTGELLLTEEKFGQIAAARVAEAGGGAKPSVGKPLEKIDVSKWAKELREEMSKKKTVNEIIDGKQKQEEQKRNDEDEEDDDCDFDALLDRLSDGDNGEDEEEKSDFLKKYKKINVYKNPELAETCRDSIETLKPKILLFCIENVCVSEFDLRLAFPVSLSKLYYVLHRLADSGKLKIEPEITSSVTLKDFEKQYGSREKYHVNFVKVTNELTAAADGNYTDEFKEMCVLALRYCISQNDISIVGIRRNVTYDFGLAYEAVHWMQLHRYAFEGHLSVSTEKFEQLFGKVKSYDLKLAQIRREQSYARQFTGGDRVSHAGIFKLEKAKELCKSSFNALFNQYDRYKGVIKTGFITSIDFRLRTDGAKLYLSDCGFGASLGGGDVKIPQILAEYDYIHLADDELVVEYTDYNYTGIAMLTLYAVVERIDALRRRE